MTRRAIRSITMVERADLEDICVLAVAEDGTLWASAFVWTTGPSGGPHRPALLGWERLLELPADDAGS